MKLISLFWIGLSVGTAFAEFDEDLRNILRNKKQNGEEIETRNQQLFNWTEIYRPPVMPSYEQLDIKSIMRTPEPFPQTKYTVYTNYERRRKMRLSIKLISVFCGLIIAGLIWMCKQNKSKTDETSTEESTLEPPGFRPAVIPLPYAPLSGPERQQSDPNIQQQEPNPRQPNLVPLSLTCIRVIAKDKLDAPRIVVIPTTTSRSPTPTIRSLIVTSKTPQSNLKE